MNSRELVTVVACAFLAASAGCGGILGSDVAPTTERPATTTGPAPGGPTTGGGELAPGLTESGVTDPIELANAHLEYVRSHGFVKHATVTRSNGTTTAVRETRLAYANQSHWRWNRTGHGMAIGSDSTDGTVTMYADGERVLVRSTVHGNVSYEVPTVTVDDREFPRPPEKVLPSSVFERSLVYQLLANANVTVDRSDFGSVAILSGTAAEMTVDGTTVTAVEFEATVAATGVVRALEFTYHDGETTVERTITFETNATNPVERPAWYDEARSQTA